MFDFSNMTRTLIRVFGSNSEKYQQNGIERDVVVDVVTEFQVLDQESGAGMSVSVAAFVKQDFPFTAPRSGDTFTHQGQRWRVGKRLEDDGDLMMIEVSK